MDCRARAPRPDQFAQRFEVDIAGGDAGAKDMFGQAAEFERVHGGFSKSSV